MSPVFISGGTAVSAPPVAPSPIPAPADALTFTLSRGGLSLVLSGQWTVLGGVEGLDDAPVSLLEERGAGMHGGIAMGVDVPPRDVFLPLALRAGSNESWRANRDFLRELTNPLLGTVRLTVTARTVTTGSWTGGRRSGMRRGMRGRGPRRDGSTSGSCCGA